ncbi:MAG: hypothetical protein ACHQFZ_10830 [Acidimicrobiales bacterium]
MRLPLKGCATNVKRFFPGVLLAAVLVFGATAQNQPGGAAPITKVAAAEQLRRDLTPVLATSTKLIPEAMRWKGNSYPPLTALKSKTQKMGEAFQKLESDLLRQSWPTDARAAVRTANSATSSVLADLHTLTTLTIYDSTLMPAWLSGFNGDLAKWQRAITLLEQDFGIKIS